MKRFDSLLTNFSEDAVLFNNNDVTVVEFNYESGWLIINEWSINWTMICFFVRSIKEACLDALKIDEIL